LLLAVLPASTRPAVRYIDCDGRYAGLTLRFPSKYVARTIADRLAREMPRLRGAVFDLAGNVLITFGGDTYMPNSAAPPAPVPPRSQTEQAEFGVGS
jgi:hypothetical protein